MDGIYGIYDSRDYVESNPAERYGREWDVPEIEDWAEIDMAGGEASLDGLLEQDQCDELQDWEIKDDELIPEEIENLDIDIGFRIP